MKDFTDTGIEAAERLDREAFLEEVGEGGREAFLEEARTSFRVMFEENQNGIQHDILRRAARDTIRNDVSGGDEATRDTFRMNAWHGVHVAFYGFVESLQHDFEFEFSSTELPQPDELDFEFSDEIVDSVWSQNKELAT